MIKIDDFILVNDESVDKKHCENVIDWFESNENLHEKGLSGSGEIDLEIKNSTDVFIYKEHFYDPVYRTMLSPFMHSLGANCKKYVEEYEIALTRLESWGICQSMNIQRYLPGEGYYHWHSESSSKDTCNRKIVWMFYLNDVEDGGTHFYHQSLTTEAKALS